MAYHHLQLLAKSSQVLAQILRAIAAERRKRVERPADAAVHDERLEGLRTKLAQAIEIRRSLLTGDGLGTMLGDGGHQEAPTRSISLFFSHSFRDEARKKFMRDCVEDECRARSLKLSVGEGADRSVGTADRITPNVISRINGCELFLCILTPQTEQIAVPSGWTFFELGIAYTLGKPIAIMAQEEVFRASKAVTLEIEVVSFGKGALDNASVFRELIRGRLDFVEQAFLTKLDKEAAG